MLMYSSSRPSMYTDVASSSRSSPSSGAARSAADSASCASDHDRFVYDSRPRASASGADTVHETLGVQLERAQAARVEPDAAAVRHDLHDDCGAVRTTKHGPGAAVEAHRAER